MGRFASTVAFYERARQPYGERFFAEVARRLDLQGGERLLDLGTGPGLLAIGFARFVSEVVGVDPEPAMIEAARAAAERARVSLSLVEGRAETLSDDIGVFDIVTIGRALHWMDPERTRSVLDRIAAPRGRILICRARSVGDGRNAWLDAYDAAKKDWTSGREGRSRDPDEFFAGGRFRRLFSVVVETEHDISVERLIDRVLSSSLSSPARLGNDAAAMRKAMAEALDPYARNAAITEIVEARAEVFASG